MKIYITLLLSTFCIIGVLAQRNISYTVEEGETINDIAKVYRVSPNDIIKLNPDVPIELKKGMLLIIPDNKVTHYSTQTPSNFKIHTVKNQETLFGLTHKYNITMDDLKRYNQFLYKKGLQVGDEITIPIFNKQVNIVEKGKPGLKKYVVKPKEGLWRIAQNHDITQSILEKLNPGITESLAEGQEIWVPDNNSEKPVRPGMVLYQVEKAEGFISLERKFGISEQDLIILNPELKDGIKLDAQIWIPIENFNQFKLRNKTDYKFQFENSNPYLLENSSPQNVNQIAFILPFKVEDISSTDKIFDLKQKLENDKLTQIASDFYLGAKMAIDSLSKKGYRFKVQVFDSNASVKGIREALRNSEIENTQVIIGPFLPRIFNELAKNIENSIPLLVPLSNSEDIKLKANVYQTLPATSYQKEVMLDYIANRFNNSNILILSDGQNPIEDIIKKLPNSKIVNNLEKDVLSSLIKTDQDNIAIVNSNDLIFLSEVIQKLHSLRIKNNQPISIRLVALEKGSAFDNSSISNTQLSALHFTYPSVNKFSKKDNNFSKDFERKYGMLPNKYIIRGFDITMDVLLRLGINSDFKAANENIEQTSYIENKFIYEPNFSRGGGYENRGVYIMEYDNLEIKELNPILKSNDIYSSSNQ